MLQELHDSNTLSLLLIACNNFSEFGVRLNITKNRVCYYVLSL